MGRISLTSRRASTKKAMAAHGQVPSPPHPPPSEDHRHHRCSHVDLGTLGRARCREQPPAHLGNFPACIRGGSYTMPPATGDRRPVCHRLRSWRRSQTSSAPMTRCSELTPVRTTKDRKPPSLTLADPGEDWELRTGDAECQQGVQAGTARGSGRRGDLAGTGPAGRHSG